MVIVVIADDFSGAAELAGIGHRFGLDVEIQTDLDTGGRLDMVVLNTNTRSMTEIDAVRKTEEVSLELIKTSAPIKIFKKVDSAMRGHVVPELSVLQYHFEYDRVLLMPANPSRNRIIKNGQYFVDGTKLSDSVFGTDPHNPISSSFVEDLINTKNTDFSHQHVSTYTELPTQGLITADVSNTVDVKHFIDQLKDFDLCCGSADAFEAFLENQDFELKNHSPSREKADHKIVINGSTVKFPDEHHYFLENNLPFEVVPSARQGNFFEVQKWNRDEKYEAFLKQVESHHIASISIDHPIRSSKKASDIFQDWLQGQVKYIEKSLPGKSLHFGLTGGATAANVLNGLEVNTLSVVEEVFPGIVTLRAESHPNILFTIKPGSYPWPDSFLKE